MTDDERVIAALRRLDELRAHRDLIRPSMQPIDRPGPSSPSRMVSQAAGEAGEGKNLSAAAARAEPLHISLKK